MLRLVVFMVVLAWGLPVAAQQSQPSWQELALRSQQNAMLQQVIDNAIISSLQSELAELRGQVAKQKQDPPPDKEKQ